MITARQAGADVEWEEFLDWGRRDRLGVIVDSPLGALGAGLLILLCTIAFYDLDRRRRRIPLYAPIYLFHVGRAWGFHGEFDFWPDRKEVMVPDRTETLAALNSHAITHLALPERSARAVVHRYKEPEELLDHLKQAFLYSPNGAVESATLTLTSSDENVLRNFDYTANLRETLALREREVSADVQLQRDTPLGHDARRYVALMRERLTEIDYDEASAARVRERVTRAVSERRLEEALAPIEPKDALARLD